MASFNVNIDLKNIYVFYILLLITASVELYAFYVLKRKNYIVGLPAFIFVGVMHALLFSTRGLIHTHAIYHVATILLVTALGLHDNEKIDGYKSIGILFALLSIIFMEFHHFKKFFGM